MLTFFFFTFSFFVFKREKGIPIVICIRYECDNNNGANSQKEILSDLVKVLNCLPTYSSEIKYIFQLTCDANNICDYTFDIEPIIDGKTWYEFYSKSSPITLNKNAVLNSNKIVTQEQYRFEIKKFVIEIERSIKIKDNNFAISQTILENCLLNVYWNSTQESQPPIGNVIDLDSVEVVGNPMDSIKKWWNNLTPTWKEAYYVAIGRILNDKKITPEFNENLMKQLFDKKSSKIINLDLSGCKLTDLSGLRYLRSLNIIDLNLSNNKLITLDELKYHHSLTRLFLQQNTLDSKAIESLLRTPSMKLLKVIRVDGNPKVDDKQIEILDSINNIDVIK